MENPDQKLIDLMDTFYEDDPKVGDVVLVRHNFENLNIAGEIVGLQRSHPHRGYDPDGDYEVVVYHRFKLRFAGIKQWLKIGEDHDWTLVQILDEKEFKKLSPDVVLRSQVDEFINQTEEDEDEL